MSDQQSSAGRAGERLAPPQRMPSVRSILVQSGALLVVAAFLWYVGGNVAANIARLNINTGFSFLWRPAGFNIAQKLIGYTEASSYFDAFVVALLNTVLLTAVSAVPATILGFVIGLARLSSNRLVATVAAAYVEVVRNIPLLLQLFFWYFTILRPLPPPRGSLSLFGAIYLNNRGLLLPAPIFEPGAATLALVGAASFGLAIVIWALGRRHRIETGRSFAAGWVVAAIALGPPAAVAATAGFPLSFEVPVLAGFNFRGGIAVIPEFVAMALALSLYGASFIAEIVRAGISSVPSGQIDAAHALGLRRRQIVSKIVLPQALRVILPPLGTQYIQMLKNSSLAAAIAYPDLMLIFAGTVLNQTGQPLEVMVVTMATYVAIGLGIAAVVNVANRRVRLVER